MPCPSIMLMLAKNRPTSAAGRFQHACPCALGRWSRTRRRDELVEEHAVHGRLARAAELEPVQERVPVHDDGPKYRAWRRERSGRMGTQKRETRDAPP
jgi:hypothetical protein